MTSLNPSDIKVQAVLADDPGMVDRCVTALANCMKVIERIPKFSKIIYGF